MNQNDLISLLSEATGQNKDQQLHIRMSQAERKMLAKLAQAYSMPMAGVVLALVRQGLIDYVQDGECFALTK